jgi:hypothetical protein
VKRPDRRRDDTLLILGWRVGAVVLLSLDGIVALGVPIAALLSGHLPPSGASKGWVYESDSGWPPFSPPSFPWWIAAAGSVVFAWAWSLRASRPLRSTWGVAVTASWFFLGGFTAMVGGLYFRRTPSWPHDVLWAGIVVALSSVVIAIASFRRRAPRNSSD